MQRRPLTYVLLFLLCAVALGGQDLPRRNMFGAAVSPDPQGVRITAVVPGSPAVSSGMQVGDVITTLGTQHLSSTADFLQAVQSSAPLSSVSVAILREGNPMSVAVKIVPVPKERDSHVETVYSSIRVEGTLRRTLMTLPKGKTGQLPAVLLIGGIGCYSVDNPADVNDPYRALSHDLSRAGIIVMRIEKSGIGDSQGAPCFDTDFDSESQMYAAGLAALYNAPRVDPHKIFLFGHSIGTLIAPRLAATNPVAGIIVAEAVGINWFEYELANLRRQSVLSGDTPEATDELLRSKEVCMHDLLVERKPETSIESTRPECKLRNAYPVAAPYVQEVAALNIAELWMKVNVRVLVIYGTADFVTSEDEHRRIVNIVDSARPGSASLKLVSGMDHHLKSMGTPLNAYNRRVKEHQDGPYAEDLSGTIVSWLCAKGTCRPAA